MIGPPADIAFDIFFDGVVIGHYKIKLSLLLWRLLSINYHSVCIHKQNPLTLSTNSHTMYI